MSDTSDADDDNPAERQRRRIDVALSNLIPHNEAMSLSNEILTFTTHCSLADIHESQVNSRVRTGKRYIDVQLLRIVVMSPNKPTNIYSRGPAKRGGADQPKQGRLFLCRIYDNDNNANSGALVYFMQTEESNKRLFLRENKLRDNGVLTIGTYFRVLAPDYISQYMNNQVPMIVSRKPAIIMRCPKAVPSVSIRSLSVNQSRAYVLNAAHLYIQELEAVNCVCNGNLCDKQQLNNVRNGKCGCYAFNTMSKCGVVFNHSIVVTPISGEDIVERHFTSQKFSQIYITKPLANSITISQIQDTEVMDQINDKLLDATEYVNNHGGWTVIGWYRLGMVTDKALVDSNQANQGYKDANQPDAQVEAGETKFHIISMYPTRESFRTLRNDDHTYLTQNQFKTEEITL